LNNERLTNVFWGLTLVWFGVVAVSLGGDILGAVNSREFALGIGVLLLLLNLTRMLLHLRLGLLTISLGAILVLIYAPLVYLKIAVPFVPALIIIIGIALIIGTLRTKLPY
jgi:peptidoglycan/LPS O-acetylase OafA/YrhL